MKAAITNGPGGEAATPAVANPANPFAALEPEWRAPAAFFAARFIHAKITPAGITTDLLYWRELGLTAADAKRILLRFCHPDVAQNYRWDTQLRPDLDAAVSDALRRRRQIEERDRRRQASTSPSSTAGVVVRTADGFALPPQRPI